MPLFAALFVGIAGQFATFLATFIAKKTAMGLAAVATLGVILVSLYVGMRGCINGLASILASLGGSGAIGQRFAQGMGMMIPAHAAQILACILATWSACVLYRWQLRGLDLFTKAS